MAEANAIDLPLERSLYIGNFLRGILYGIELYVFLQAVSCVRNRRAHRLQRVYVALGGVLLLLVTIAVATDALWGQLMWIEHRNYPGGPLAYFSATSSFWMNVFGSAADATANTLGDGLLLYRCYMIWGSRPWAVAVPFLIWLASTAMVIITVVNSALPGAYLLNGDAANFGVPWVSLSVSLNIILTCLICGRLLMMRSMTRMALSPEMGKMYTSVMAILVESALPFSIIGIGLIVTYAKNDETATALAYVWGMFCSLSPQMIILRVAAGQGWTEETVAQVTKPMSFAAAPVKNESGFDQTVSGPASDTYNASDGFTTKLGASSLSVHV